MKVAKRASRPLPMRTPDLVPGVPALRALGTEFSPLERFPGVPRSCFPKYPRRRHPIAATRPTARPYRVPGLTRDLQCEALNRPRETPDQRPSR